MRRARALLLLAVVASCVGCDHAIKSWAVSWLSGEPPLDLAGGWVRFELALNPGAFLGLGTGLAPWLRTVALLGLVPLALAIVLGVLLRSSSLGRVRLLGVGLFVGGGLGNWIDRLLHDGSVTDFLVLGAGSLRTGVFNLADVAIVLGVLLFAAAPHRPGSADLRSGGPPG